MERSVEEEQKLSSGHENTKQPHFKVFHHSQVWGTTSGDDVEESDSEDEEIDQTKGSSSLQKLVLSSNQITKIPLGLSCLAPSLGTLNLSNNHISDVPSLSVFPPSLGTLDLSYNNIGRFHPVSVFPTSVNEAESKCYSTFESQRPSVKRRISAESGLQEAGKVRFCRHMRHRTLPNLKRLDLNHNKLREVCFILPRDRSASVATVPNKTPPKNDTDWFGGKQSLNSRNAKILFPSLQSLTLSHNELSSLPKDVGFLSKLGSLHLSYTRISQLPPEVGLLSELWDLQYQGLQLQDIEPSVLERKKTKDIVGYLRSVLEK